MTKKKRAVQPRIVSVVHNGVTLIENLDTATDEQLEQLRELMAPRFRAALALLDADYLKALAAATDKRPETGEQSE